jgi:hypothetical protein
MLLYKRGYILLLFLAALMVVGCNKKDTEGTEITPVTEAFQIEEAFKVSNSNPDFVKEAIYFTAEFSEEVTSVITIRCNECNMERES